MMLKIALYSKTALATALLIAFCTGATIAIADCDDHICDEKASIYTITEEMPAVKGICTEHFEVGTNVARKTAKKMHTHAQLNGTATPHNTISLDYKTYQSSVTHQYSCAGEEKTGDNYDGDCDTSVMLVADDDSARRFCADDTGIGVTGSWHSGKTKSQE